RTLQGQGINRKTSLMLRLKKIAACLLLRARYFNLRIKTSSLRPTSGLREGVADALLPPTSDESHRSHRHKRQASRLGDAGDLDVVDQRHVQQRIVRVRR